MSSPSDAPVNRMTAVAETAIRPSLYNQEENVCFHCGLPVPTPGEFQTVTETGPRDFCCAGCLAVSGIICAGGLERYYTRRESPGVRPDPVDLEQFLVYDNPNLQTGWLNVENSRAEAEFLISGITCAACVWLIENWLSRLPGVDSATVNFSTHRLNVSWDFERHKVSDIMQAVHQVGYTALPYTRETRKSHQEGQRRDLLKRLGVAAALGMQIMVISVALYAGDWFGMEPEMATFLRRVNLLLVLPIMGYSARPFFSGAWRGLRSRSPGMDLPVSLGIGLAFAGSLWATVSGHGEVYYDSIAMFTFFLLGARYLELASRLKGAREMDAMAAVVPDTARIWRDDGSLLTVPVVETSPGDRLQVRAGEVVPADGTLLEGESSFDEALMTGENRPVPRGPGDPVLAGSVNIAQPVTLVITTPPGATTLDSILHLAERSHSHKPRISHFAEQVSRWFVVAVVLLACAVASVGLWMGNAAWLPTTIAVLVVTCPCALSLATPLALSAGAASLVRLGVHITRGHALETLNRVTHVIFDKTGTLTRGTMTLERIIPLGRLDDSEVLLIAAALERGSSHPLAKPIQDAASNSPLPLVSDFMNLPGQGIRGSIAGQVYNLGTASLVFTRVNPAGDATDKDINPDVTDPVIFLGDESGPLARFHFRDQLRPGAVELVHTLQSNGVSVSLLSGDHQGVVNAVAGQVGIKEARAACLPEEKLAILEKLIDRGLVVAMAGDGINDAPALARAHLGMALARNVNLAAANADIVVTADDLSVVAEARRTAARTFRIIRQNIIWALSYNALAVPAALAGMVPPWLAGIGMSLSSVVVVLNASRLNRS